MANFDIASNCSYSPEQLCQIVVKRDDVKRMTLCFELHSLSSHPYIGPKASGKRQPTCKRNHCNTLTIINNLVVSYCSLSQLSEAARLQNDALTVCKKKFGEADPL